MGSALEKTSESVGFEAGANAMNQTLLIVLPICVSAVPMVVRQELPPALVSQLEDRVSGEGKLSLIGVSAAPGKSVDESTFRSTVIDGQEFRAFVYGRRADQATGLDYTKWTVTDGACE